MCAVVQVQQVSKASSDKLLNKFAELDLEIVNHPPLTSKAENVSRKKKIQVLRKAKTERKIFEREVVETTGGSGNMVEWKTLLPTATRRSSLLRHFGFGQSKLGPREVVKYEFLFVTIQKTWRKTVEGASKVFVERHRGNHIRLIDDAV